jgi:hypothetical protein
MRHFSDSFFAISFRHADAFSPLLPLMFLPAAPLSLLLRRFSPCYHFDAAMPLIIIAG